MNIKYFLIGIDFIFLTILSIPYAQEENLSTRKFICGLFDVITEQPIP